MVYPPPAMSHPYPPYYPFMLPNGSSPFSYPGFVPPQMMPAKKDMLSIDPQLLPQGPVRFELPNQAFSSLSGGGFPGYLPFPPMMPMSTPPIYSDVQPDIRRNTVEIVPPTGTPLKRKRKTDSGSPTPSPSVRRVTRTRTPKKLADDTLVYHSKGR